MFGNFSHSSMSTAEIREMAELRRQHELELIKARSDAKINEIHASAQAEIKTSTHHAGLLSDLFQKKATLDAGSETHATHEFGKKLGLLQEHESFMTTEQAKRHHQELEVVKRIAQQRMALESSVTNEHRQRTKYETDLFERKAFLEASSETHTTHEFEKKLKLLEEHESSKTVEEAKRHHQEIEATKRITHQHKTLEASVTNEHRKRTNYQIEGTRADHQAQLEYLDKQVSANRTMMTDTLRYQHVSNLLQANPDNGVVIEEMSDSDIDSDNETALVKRK